MKLNNSVCCFIRIELYIGSLFPYQITQKSLSTLIVRRFLNSSWRVPCHFAWYLALIHRAGSQKHLYQTTESCQQHYRNTEKLLSRVMHGCGVPRVIRWISFIRLIKPPVFRLFYQFRLLITAKGEKTKLFVIKIEKIYQILGGAECSLVQWGEFV